MAISLLDLYCSCTNDLEITPDTSSQAIINFGPQTTPAYFASDLGFAAISSAPLDGVVVEARTNLDTEFSTHVWDPSNLFNVGGLSDSISYLLARKAAGWGKIRYNFAKLQIMNPGNMVVDPFDPAFDTVISNLNLMGQFAAQARLYGIFFDVEGYMPVWIYNQQPLKNSHTFAEYQARYYNIGKNLATVWRTFNPDMSVMFTNAYDGYANRGAPYEANEWGLYTYFLDGFLDGWGDFGVGEGKVILTTEQTYGELSPANIIRYGLGQINGTFDSSAPPPDHAYWGDSEYFFDSNVVEHGLALWPTKPAFNPATPQANYWTPAKLASQAGVVLDNTRWVWIFDYQYSFYNGSLGQLPQAYTDELNLVRVEKGLAR